MIQSMFKAITEGIQVSVEVTYQSEFSNPNQHHFVFTYRVTIENQSQHTIQLISRKWEIFDAAESSKIVEGIGVVGQQPTLEPGESHTYVSGCNLKSGLGKMRGNFLMEKIFDGKQISVLIPEFQLIANIFHN
jgi:ApaG protein